MCTDVYRPTGIVATRRSVVIRLANHRDAQTACVCICCLYIALIGVHTQHAMIVASSHMCRSEAGAAVPPRFITASHACTLPCIPSPYLSFPLPICNLFRINSSFVLSVYPLSSVSHLHLFRTLSRIAISPVLIRCPSIHRCAPDRGHRIRGVLHCLHASSHASHLHILRSLSQSAISSV